MLLTYHLKTRHYYYQCDTNGLKPYCLHIQGNTQSSSDSKPKLHLEETDRKTTIQQKMYLVYTNETMCEKEMFY